MRLDVLQNALCPASQRDLRPLVEPLRAERRLGQNTGQKQRTRGSWWSLSELRGVWGKTQGKNKGPEGPGGATLHALAPPGPTRYLL
jgi:hypothetical protein